jgi:drug/metabolite transporter (DMT)-like permease
VLVPFTLAEAALIGTAPLTWRTFFLVAVVGLLPGFAAYQAHSFTQAVLGSAKTGLMLYLIPPYAALAAWAVLGEVPRWYHYAGAALILPGMWLATRPQANPAQK